MVKYLFKIIKEKIKFLCDSPGGEELWTKVKVGDASLNVEVFLGHI